MSETAKSPLAERVETIILGTFDVSATEARQRAEWLVAEAETWGGDSVAFLDWEFQVRRQFGLELPWRSETERRRFLTSQQTSASADQPHPGNRNPPPQPGSRA